MKENLSKFTVGDLNIICGRGIQLSDGCKRKKAELFDLCKKAVTVKQFKVASFASDSKKLLKDKLRTSEGKFPVPKYF